MPYLPPQSDFTMDCLQMALFLKFGNVQAFGAFFPCGRRFGLNVHIQLDDD
ncbi:hypothetical protein DPMN_078755 [Dreissena polymorpha]|uniref:Uncharacterized protein n=1 Tax=Dreissena polymorpha TaxID=45954 RepID=A0A9D4BSE8_DREPO|nr:hypothetical protein DPMN_078755 [Dreissena polymorpha]